MDLMVMENLFFRRRISRVYDLKGSSRSRYNPDTSGTNKVLLDMNLLETLRTKPIFLGSKAKRSLERAVWNDTSFLAVIFFFSFIFCPSSHFYECIKVLNFSFEILNTIKCDLRTKFEVLICDIVVDITYADVL